MQAVKGYLHNGRFEPSDDFELPSRAQVLLVIEKVIADDAGEADGVGEAEMRERMAGLRRIEEMIRDSQDEDLSDFPVQGRMKLPEDYPWHD